MSEETSDPSSGPPVLLDVTDGVAWITLNRPQQLNVVTRPLVEALFEALVRVADDEDTRVVVVTGAGRAFCAGGDLSESLTEVTGAGPVPRQTSELRRLMRSSQLLLEMDKVTIAAVNGACAGAGLGLASCADVRLASDRAVFVTAFVNVGVSGDFGGTWGLSRAVGAGVARELYLTSRRIDAAEALRLGLVSEVVEEDALVERTRTLATELAAKPPLAVAAVKRNFNGLPASLADVLEREAASHVRCTNTEDAEEARRAFLEKRPGRFFGR